MITESHSEEAEKSKVAERDSLKLLTDFFVSAGGGGGGVGGGQSERIIWQMSELDLSFIDKRNK